MISVIIPTLNRADLLNQTLSSISRQTLSRDRFEVIVVDNGSTDNTAEVVRTFAKNEMPIRYVLETSPGLHAGRHRGMKEAVGSILTYADDDIQAFPEWLETIKQCFADERIAIVGGKDLPNYQSTPPKWMDSLWISTNQGKYLTYFSLIDLGDKVMEIDPAFVFGCNFSIRKSILKEVGGFHPDGMPSSLIKLRGDGETHVAEAVRALGYKTIYHPLASVYHWVPTSRMDKAYIAKRAFADGVTESYRHTRQGKSLTENSITKVLRRLRETLLDEVEKQIRKNFRRGYEFHQNEVMRDPELRSWVLRESYIDC